jgi:hypothetical protein
MIAEVLLVGNSDEVTKYNMAVEEHGFEELFNLGRYDKPVSVEWTVCEMGFSLEDVRLAWVVNQPQQAINIKFDDGDVWSLVYKEEIWEEIKKLFEE